MSAVPEPYRVLERPGTVADGDGALETFASLFEGNADLTSIVSFPVVLAPGTRLAPHRHTAELAAGVVSGSMTFVFGADGTGRVDLGPGDYIWIREGVMHDEETTDGVEMVVAHVAPFETLSE
jgi:uncharacterized RmlC-like cupin family protein